MIIAQEFLAPIHHGHNKSFKSDAFRAAINFNVKDSGKRKMDDEKEKAERLDSLIVDLRNLPRSLRDAGIASITFSQEANRALEYHAKAIASIQKFSLPTVNQQEQFAKIAQSFQIPRIEIDSEILRVFKYAQEAFSASIVPVMEKFRHDFERLPARTQEALLLLGAHGWYLDLNMAMPSLWKLSEVLESGNVEEAEAFLIGHFEERIPEILSELTSKFPERAHLIEAAFRAHLAGQYALSIPVLLAQTDGICKDSFDGYYFMKGKGKTTPETAVFVEQVSKKTFRAALLSPLAVGLPISASKKDRSATSIALNRHMVMHGESLDYGSKINGLKAISLVNYVSQMVRAESP